jgi:hypothetical protein
MAKREKEKRIFSLQQDFMRLALRYRKHFQKDATAPLEDDDKGVLPSCRILQKRILDVLKGIHKPDAPVDLKLLQDTDEDFRSLSRVLQHMGSISCSLTNLSQYYDTDSREYVDLAECLVLQLVKLDQDRSLLVESAKNHWTGNSKEPPVSALPASTNGDDEESPPQQQSSVTGWFSRLVEGLVPSFHVAEQQADAPGAATLELEQATAPVEVDPAFTIPQDDISLQATKRLFRNVMASIASTVRRWGTEEQQNSFSPATATMVVDDRSAYETTARRMMDLLDRMPSSWAPDTEALCYIMEILCRGGTLRSARMCHAVYNRHTSNRCRLQFTLVLEAYLEAVMRETNKERLLVLVEDVMDALSTHWNSSLPTHRVERIMHCSIALNCMAVAGAGAVPGMCERGELISKRALGGQIYAQLRQEIYAEKPKVDAHTLPVANYLAQLFASSGDDGRVELAKKMLNYMIQHDRNGGSRFMVFPNVETCNAILFALVKRYEGKSASENDMEAAQADFDFAQCVLDYMYGRSETVCWPNSNTHVFMFRFLDALNPADIGNIAEDLLTTMESRQFLSRSDTDMITLSTYHRVLRYWLQVAKSPPSSKTERRSIACQKAFLLLRRLEVQSIPVALSDSFLSSTVVKNLYNISLRPVRKTYKLVLQICVDTSEPNDHDNAASIAFEVYRMMIKRGIDTGDDTQNLLTMCCSRLAPESEKRKEIEEFLSEQPKDDSLQSA